MRRVTDTQNTKINILSGVSQSYRRLKFDHLLYLSELLERYSGALLITHTR